MSLASEPREGGDCSGRPKQLPYCSLMPCMVGPFPYPKCFGNSRLQPRPCEPNVSQATVGSVLNVDCSDESTADSNLHAMTNAKQWEHQREELQEVALMDSGNMSSFGSSIASVLISFSSGPSMASRGRRPSSAGSNIALSITQAIQSQVGDSFPSHLRSCLNLIAQALMLMTINLAWYVNDLVNLAVASMMFSQAELVGVGLAISVANIVSDSTIMGMLQGLEGLVGNAFGASDFLSCELYAQRAKVFVTCQLVWIIPVLASTSSLIALLGVDPVAAETAGSYNQATAIGVIFRIQFEAVSQLLNGCLDSKGPVMATVLSSCLHILWIYIYVVRFGMGPQGAGLALSTTWLVQALLISAYAYMFVPQIGLTRWGSIALGRAAFKHWCEFLIQAIPTWINAALVYWFWESCTLLAAASSNSTAETAGHVLLLMEWNLLSVVGLGFETVVAIRVGAESAISRKAVQRIVAHAVVCLLLICGIVTVLAIGLKTWLIHTFSSDNDVRDCMERLYPLFISTFALEALNQTFGGILRGLLRPGEACVVALVGYYGVGLSLAGLFYHLTDLGVAGAWWSMLAASVSLTLMFAVRLTILVR